MYLKKIKDFKADTLILGCTHYPLLKKTLKRVVGAKVSLVDSAQEVAAEVKERLISLDLTNTSKKKGKLKFLISDKPQSFKKIARNFLGFNLSHVAQIKDR